MGQLNQVAHYLEKSIEEIIVDCFTKPNNIIKFDFQNKIQFRNLALWDRILSLLPTFLTVASSFRYVGEVVFVIDEKTLQIKASAKISDNIEDKREEIYALTRRLLAEKAVLTFKIHNETNGRADIVLNLDISHNDFSIYALDLIEKQGLLLGFSNLFSNYRIEKNSVNSQVHHPCIEITEELEVIKRDYIPVELLTHDSSREIFHFPFLFRPLSLIIPIKGKIFPISYLGHLGVTGSGENEKSKRDSAHTDRKVHFSYIDFFSLLLS